MNPGLGYLPTKSDNATTTIRRAAINASLRLADAARQPNAGRTLAADVLRLMAG
jgi:hypothetical protein